LTFGIKMRTKVILTLADHTLVGKYSNEHDHVHVILDSTTGPFTVTLPDCRSNIHTEIIFKNIGVNDVAIVPSTGQYIDNKLTHTIKQWDLVTVWPDLLNTWYLLDSNVVPDNAAGWLHNNGAGILAWSTPTYTDVGAAPAAHGVSVGYIPKSASVTSWNNSLLYDNGTSIILGGTSSIATFQVNDAYNKIHFAVYNPTVSKSIYEVRTYSSYNLTTFDCYAPIGTGIMSYNAWAGDTKYSSVLSFGINATSDGTQVGAGTVNSSFIDSSANLPGVVLPLRFLTSSLKRVEIGTTGGMTIFTTYDVAQPPSLKIANAAAESYYWHIWRDNHNDGSLNFGVALGGSVATRFNLQDTGALTLSGQTTGLLSSNNGLLTSNTITSGYIPYSTSTGGATMGSSPLSTTGSIVNCSVKLSLNADGASAIPLHMITSYGPSEINFRQDVIDSAEWGYVLDVLQTGSTNTGAFAIAVASVNKLIFRRSGLIEMMTNVGIGVLPSYALHVAGDIFTTSTNKNYWNDTSTYAQYSSGDLLIATAANKTLKLSQVTYDDIQFPVSVGKVPPSHYPTFETFTANTAEHSFAVADYIDLIANEPFHKWVEASVWNFHMHVTLKAANNTGSNRYAKFTVHVAYCDVAGTWAETPLTAELTIPTGSGALQQFYLDLGDVTPTGLHIGSQVKVRLYRIAATGGTEYSGNIFVTQVGNHIQMDTIGSRQETVK
jgi:hypothetical protein